MQLQPGDHLGPHQILEPIGKGGMGEVWKARDTRLDRIVAIKTSKQQFSERFEREARAVAAPAFAEHPGWAELLRRCADRGIAGITPALMKDALEQARKGRLHILEAMAKLPSLDPFLLKDRLSAPVNEVDPGYFAIAPAETSSSSAAVTAARTSLSSLPRRGLSSFGGSFCCAC